MRKYLIKLWALLITIALVSCSTDGPVDIHPEKNLTLTDKQMISTANDFGFDIFKSVNKNFQGQNVFISPLSISMALGMAYNGSAGTTRDAFVNTLHYIGMDETAINESYKNINDILSKLDNNVKFGLANSIWYRQGWTFEQNFIDINKKYFYAEVSALDFSDPLAPGVINNWVESKTNGKIKKLLDKISESTVMYLINTIYFNAPWKFKFDKNKTTTELFHNSNKIAINCNMMNSYGGYDQYTDETLTALSLPYGNGSFRMLLLQPQGVNIDEYIAQLDYTKFAEINATLKKININISVPRFKMEFEDKLNDYLANLGLSIAFMPGAADFSNMYKGPESLFISEVKHKSYVDVNEEGTEAAAATSIGIDLTATPNSFKFNSPFVFIIHDTKTNTVMFIGKMEKPE